MVFAEHVYARDEATFRVALDEMLKELQAHPDTPALIDDIQYAIGPDGFGALIRYHLRGVHIPEHHEHP